jgi:tRNA threonylcarbamoyladenosine biosynthesis protein TsaE
MENKKISYITESPKQTKKIGELLAQAILAGRPAKRARVLALRGDLGAGKTNFTQGFAAGLGIKGTVNSPTFVILKKYPLKNCGTFKTFYHIDCYRLGSSADLAHLGVESILNDPADIVAIEWPDIARDILPENVLKIYFEPIEGNKRRVVFEAW